MALDRGPRIIRAMWTARRPRRLATILFLDIVGSTTIAAELGDRRWKTLLDHFRSVVRGELKRHRGHEEDTAGDSFFATFDQPAQAVRAAAAIVRRVQELGLDVRCGLHFGEAETIEGERGGIAVHIGSRVMSLAGPAEVLVTSTVRDLIVGAEATVEDAGAHELKGVPGSWQVWRLRAVDETPLPAPLDQDVAAAIRSGHGPAISRDRRRIVIATVALASIVVLGTVTAFLVQAGPAGPTILRIDPTNDSISQQITDDYRSEHYANGLWSVNGALWQAVTQGFTGLVRRDIQTGAVQQKIPVAGDPQSGAFGFGSIWLGGIESPGSVDRWDAVTGRAVADLTVDATIASMDASSSAVWVLGDKGDLFKIDPLSNQVTGTYRTPTQDPGVVITLADDLWVCDCEHHRIVEFDPVANRTVRTLTFAEAGFLVGLVDENGRKTAWLLDPTPDAATLTPIDVESGVAGQPIGIGSNLHAAAVSFGSLWVAAGDRLLRIQGSGPQVLARIAMPPGFSAGAIAADPQTGALWIGNCGCPIH